MSIKILKLFGGRSVSRLILILYFSAIIIIFFKFSIISFLLLILNIEELSTNGISIILIPAMWQFLATFSNILKL